ncbi:MAG: membrane dipeptidase [Chloroflexota bacterium]|nr:membrane dipeptidase [Chloroflexota bacterium]
MTAKRYDGYRSYRYLRAGEDYRAFALAKEIGRVPEHPVDLMAEEERRWEAIVAAHPVISLHDHTAVSPADTALFIEQRREGRDVTGYAGLAASGTDVFFESFMDGTALVTSKHGWKWDDVILDLGMRLSDIAHQDLVYVATTVDDVLAAKPDGRIAFVASLEAATAIENEVDRVDVLYGFGIRCMGITYSEANALGSGLREQSDGGLTQLGRQVVRRMNALGMTIDLAHVGDRTSLDVIERSEKPVLITHAGARGLWPTRRMKPDEVLTALAAKGGVIGIEAAPHTTLTKAHPRHSVESVVDHVEYCLDLVGPDHVALGPDTLFGDHVGLHHAFADALSLGSAHAGISFEEVEYVTGMENPGESMRNALRLMVKRGLSDDVVAKVAGENVIRVLKATWAR